LRFVMCALDRHLLNEPVDNTRTPMGVASQEITMKLQRRPPLRPPRCAPLFRIDDLKSPY
jgi:hypothetical protein